MMHWTVEQILEATAGRLICGTFDMHFTGVGIDSRTIGPEQVFVAIRGASHDGHSFIQQVAARGVKGFVVAEDYPAAQNHPFWQVMGGAACVAVPDTTHALGKLAAFQRAALHIPVIAITGSNGKTTTRRMTALVLRQQYQVLASEGNFNNEIGLPLTLFHLTRDHQVAVVELGMNHFGEMARLGAICRPTIGVITTVGPAHLAFLGSLEGVARAKGELIAQIEPGGSVVLNRDDPHVAALAGSSSRRVFFFGTSVNADVMARNIVDEDQGVAFDLVLPSVTLPIQLQTPGRFMVTNALAAAAAGYLAGVPAQGIKAGLEAFIPGKGRLHVATTPGHVHVIDDTYNANPASMAAAIDTLTRIRRNAPGIIVVGDMLELGDQAMGYHRRIGTLAAASGAARLCICGQFAEAVRQGARAGGMSEESIFIGTKDEIVADLLTRLAPGQWVLIKGSRGMAMETIVAALSRATTPATDC